MIQLKRELVPGREDMRVYHSRTVLTDKPHEVAMAKAKVKNPFLQEVLEIPGVFQCQLMPYCVVITKAKMYEWEEIEPRLRVLLGCFNHSLPAKLDFAPGEEPKKE